MLALPAAYIAGVQVLGRSLLADVDPVLLEGRFTAESFVVATRALRDDVDRFTSLVPAQLATLLDAAQSRADVRDALTSYRAILVGGQALPPSLHERAGDLGARIVRTYGSSETAGGCVYDGLPLDGVHLAEVDGEVRISGPMLADGYLGDPVLTAGVFSTEGGGVRWYRPATRAASPPMGVSRSPAASTTSSSRAVSTCRSTGSSGRCAASRVSSTPWWSASPMSAGVRHPSSSPTWPVQTRRDCSRPAAHM